MKATRAGSEQAQRGNDKVPGVRPATASVMTAGWGPGIINKTHLLLHS